jgi:hypothetical protein
VFKDSTSYQASYNYLILFFFRYLAIGCSFHDLHFSYRIRLSTASNIVRETCRSIWSIMRPECIPKPTKGQWELTALQLEITANFPNRWVAVDGKHIRVIKPEHRDSIFYNYKDCFLWYYWPWHTLTTALCMLTLVVTEKTVILPFFNDLRYGHHTGIRSDRPLSGTDGPHVPNFIVWDEGITLNINVLRPFGGSNQSVNKSVYNYRLFRARRYVECAFGILSNKWRIFPWRLNVSPDFAADNVKVCVVLHNFVRERDGYKFEVGKYTIHNITVFKSFVILI